jgi:hypothetical protein
MDTTLRFIDGATHLPGVSLTVISEDPVERIPADTRSRLAGHWRIDNALDSAQLVDGARHLERSFGKPERMFGPLEQLQVPLAIARERLGIEA